MAAGQLSKKENEAVNVFCADCLNFQRETEGISYRRDSGEFFMGICLAGCYPDSPKKQFADKPRLCDRYLFDIERHLK